ncbi:MAG: hypothetical protein GBAus27B_000536 [Mycoplasmataceae bacterium]|nr:MAG: hypothetical protein GBAus27B_000536 [Mycoplasmataceae bacterium]
MQEIKVNNSFELKDKVKELVNADKELKICEWYSQSQTVSFEPNGQKKW